MASAMASPPVPVPVPVGGYGRGSVGVGSVGVQVARSGGPASSPVSRHAWKRRGSREGSRE